MEIEPVIDVFDKKLWKTDINAYARAYYHLKNKDYIPCICGESVKKLVMCKHIKTKNHKYNMMGKELLDLKKLKEEKENV